MEKHFFSFNLSKLCLIFLFLFQIIEKFNSQSTPTIKELRSSMGTGQDLTKIDLGISEKYPNTRVMYYVDLNNDK
jgi:hypothetical protein